MSRFVSWIRKVTGAACAALLLAGCAQQEQPAPTAPSKPSSLPRLGAMRGASQGKPAEPSHRFKYRELLAEETQRENRPSQGASDQPNGPWGGYDPRRLAKSAQVHEWWPVDGPESGFQVLLRTQWKEGRLVVNVLIVGPVVNINRFLASVKTLQVLIMDTAGNPLANWDLTPSDFQWVNNDGTAGTMVFKTQVDYPLETYEQFQNWNFNWTFP